MCSTDANHFVGTTYFTVTIRTQLFESGCTHILFRTHKNKGPPPNKMSYAASSSSDECHSPPIYGAGSTHTTPRSMKRNSDLVISTNSLEDEDIHRKSFKYASNGAGSSGTPVPGSPVNHNNNSSPKRSGVKSSDFRGECTFFSLRFGCVHTHFCSAPKEKKTNIPDYRCFQVRKGWEVAKPHPGG